MRPDDIGLFYVRNNQQTMVALDARDAEQGIRPTYTNRFNLYRAVQLLGGAGPGTAPSRVTRSRSRQGHAAAEMATTSPTCLQAARVRDDRDDVRSVVGLRVPDLAALTRAGSLPSRVLSVQLPSSARFSGDRALRSPCSRRLDS